MNKFNYEDFEKISYYKNVIEDPKFLIELIERSDDYLNESSKIPKWAEWTASGDVPYVFGLHHILCMYLAACKSLNAVCIAFSVVAFSPVSSNSFSSSVNITVFLVSGILIILEYSCWSLAILSMPNFPPSLFPCFNNNSYIINITSYSNHLGRARGFIVYSGEYEVMATDLQNIPNFTFVNDIITTNNYFQDDVIHSQDFVYNYNKDLTTKDNTKVENII